MFQWCLSSTAESKQPVSFIIADYNPTVLQLVTLPNFILSWALTQQATIPALQDAFAEEGELELSPEVIGAFQEFLTSRGISLCFLSGGWSPEFVELLYAHAARTETHSTLVLGAETIYSPSALQAFAETTLSILNREQAAGATSAVALVGAKQHYFGVGGSLEDFVIEVQGRGATVARLRQETAGVRRGVISCTVSNDSQG
jgi:protein-histidine N-methyltransferase